MIATYISLFQCVCVCGTASNHCNLATCHVLISALDPIQHLWLRNFLFRITPSSKPPVSLHYARRAAAIHPMFSWLLSCCRRQKRQHDPEGVPNERTPIIPPTEDPPTVEHRVVDHQKLKDRLGSVLKSKETKMVNVNAQFPFNLHNQHLDEPSPSRSSHNVSGGTYGSSRHASPSPRPSLKKSHSSTSIHPDQEDLFSSQVLAANGNHLPAILNVRLVRAERPTGSHGPTDDQGCGVLSRGEQPGRSGFPELDPSLPPGSENETHLSAGEGNRTSRRLSLSEDPPRQEVVEPRSPESFIIHDAGAVSCSWTD